jgi:membrane protease YdiL (CAAX protease family)
MRQRTSWWFRIRILLPLVTPLAFQGIAYLVLSLLRISGEEYSNVLINIALLVGGIVVIRVARLSAEDVGFRIIRGLFLYHVIICLSLFLLNTLFYVYVVRIASLRPVTSATVFGLLNYIVVSFAEELYYRGAFYGIIQKQYSGRAALIASTLLFGLVHFGQGMGMIPKFFTGFVWGTVRYTTGMIFLIIIPLHFTYNAVYLLFEGGWNEPRTYFYPLFELLAGLVILSVRRWSVRGKLNDPQ